jgi:hypothetical protein
MYDFFWNWAWIISFLIITAVFFLITFFVKVVRSVRQQTDKSKRRQ